MSSVQVYAYSGCSTCKKALKWLESHDVEVEVLPIVEAPPTAEQLARIRSLAGVDVKKLFNTSGQSYRQGGWKDRLPSLSEEEALQALAANGMLIKRPLVVGADFALVGFREADYAARFQ